MLRDSIDTTGRNLGYALRVLARTQGDVSYWKCPAHALVEVPQEIQRATGRRVGARFFEQLDGRLRLPNGLRDLDLIRRVLGKEYLGRA